MITTTIFPDTILRDTINREWTKNELLFIHKQKESVNQNEGNLTSKNKYILNAPEMSNLKKEALDICNEYLRSIACASKDIEVYITQSWLNWTEHRQFHHMHVHANSIYSGVIYIEAYDYDEITFHDLKHYPIQIEPTELNVYNARHAHIPVKTKDIILFNSALPHSVQNRQVQEGTRVSLAFNTFVKGNLGSNEKLTKLVL